jgi:hypothetical protein
MNVTIDEFEYSKQQLEEKNMNLPTEQRRFVPLGDLFRLQSWQSPPSKHAPAMYIKS